MKYSIVGSSMQVVGQVETILNSAWNTVLAFVGATEDSSLWWKSVFERKILKGDVGISIRWFHSKKIDVLWELEALVGSLSKEDQASAHKLREMAQSSENASNFTKPGSVHDCSLNNYRFTRHVFNGEHLKRISVHDNVQHNNSDEYRSQIVDRFPEQYLYGLNQTACNSNQSAGYTEDNLMTTLTSMNATNESIQHGEAETLETWRHCPSVSLSDCRRLRRSVSCPELSFVHGCSVVEPNLIRSRINTSSLPSLYLQENVCRRERPVILEKVTHNSHVKIRRRFCNSDQIEINDSNYPNIKMIPWVDEDKKRIIGRDWSSYIIDLDNLLVHRDYLNLLWENNWLHDTDSQDTNDFCKLYDCPANRNNLVCDWSEQNVAKCCNDILLNTQTEDLYYCVPIVTPLDNLQDQQDSNIETFTENQTENKTEASDSCITDCASFECGDETLSNEMNWNARNGYESDTGTPTDRLFLNTRGSGCSNPASRRQTSTLRNAVQLPELSTEAGTVNAHQPTSSNPKYSSHSERLYNDGLNSSCERSLQNDEKKKSFVTNLIRKGIQKVARALTSDDTFVRTHHLKKSKQMTDLTKLDDRSESMTSDIVNAFKFDVSAKPDDPDCATILMKRYLGFEEVLLPEPPTFDTEDELSEVQPMASLSKFVSIPLNLILRPLCWIQSFWNMSEEMDLDSQETKTRLNGIHYTLETDNVNQPRTESKYNIRKLEAERNYYMKFYQWKQDTLMNVVRIARDYYSDPTEMNLVRWKCLKRDLSRQHESFTDVTMQVTKIPDYLPYFTIALTMVQLLTLCIMCLRHGITNAGVITVSQVRTGIPTFLGTETFRRFEEPNPWFGPPVDSFIAAGAVLAICMRPLEQLEISTTKKGYKIMTQSNRNYFGCCQMGILFNRAGTSTQHECADMTSGLGKWTMGVLCSDRTTTKNSIAHVIKPCCSGYLGDCVMTSHEHCSFIQGIFQLDYDHCVQVNCQTDHCRLSKHSETNPILLNENAPWLPSPTTQWQWWRFLTGIPLVYGVIHFIVLMPVQLIMMIPLEMCLGWHRVIIIYVSSSVIGEMVAASFEPSVPHVGSTSGVGGILGVAVLELFQAWNFLRCPQWEAVKLSAIIILFSFLGTFYLISIVSFISGLLVGMMVCLIIVPYITYGRRLGHFRCRLVLIGFILMSLTLGILYRHLHLLKDCHVCLLLECIPYTAGMCTTYYQIIQKMID